MNLFNRLQRVAVVGAGGKMGSGIALLLLPEIACIDAETTGKIGSGKFKLILIDTHEEALEQLHSPLRHHLRKYAEQNINRIRKLFESNASLVSNEDIVNYFVNQGLTLVRLSHRIEESQCALLIFEAIVEDINAKITLFKTITSFAHEEAYYLTNTSSIPIGILSHQAKLEGRLIGFHFYNPPVVQKLLEIIPPAGVRQDLKDLADALAKRLKKTEVLSKDVAGFIGNGYFLREILFALKRLKDLSQDPLKGMDFMNQVTQELLVRPMGIFQLIDYVGIDVCQKIAQTMQTYLPSEDFHTPLLDSMVQQEVVGGQYPDGKQKNGFYQYEGHKRTGIYSLQERKYVSVETFPQISLPKEHFSWKVLQKDPDKESKLHNYFKNLEQDNRPEAQLAKAFLENLKEIAKQLVATGIAKTFEDVALVLKGGFFHLYMP